MSSTGIDTTTIFSSASLKSLAKRSAPAAGIFLASRFFVLMIFGAVAKISGQNVYRYLMRWDSRWYLMIAHWGYVTRVPAGQGPRVQVDLGFFPGLPLIVRFSHAIFGGRYGANGLVMTFFAGLFGSIVLHRILEQRFGTTAASQGLALVVFSPAAVVLSMVYSEAWIILLVSLSIWALDRRIWWFAGLAAGIATSFDPVGAVAVLPCLYVAYQELRTKRNWEVLAAPLLAPLGILWFFLYLWRHTGHFMEYFHAQRAGWQHGPMFTGVFYNIGQFALHFFGSADSAAKALGAFAAVAMIVWLWKKNLPATWWAYLGGALFMASMSPLIGFSPRVLLRAFPIIGATGATLPRRVFVVVLGLSMTCLACLTILSVTFFWTP